MPGEAGAAVILAAAGGERLRSERPRVLHRVGGRALVAWVVAAAREAGCAPIHLITGSGAGEIREALEEECLLEGDPVEDDPAEDGVVPGLRGGSLIRVPRRRQEGPRTDWPRGLAILRETLRAGGPVLVLSGAAPLVRPATLRKLQDSARGVWGSLAVADLDDPGGLDRVIRRRGRLERIVEAADADERELANRTVNAGHYALPAPAILDWLERLVDHRDQGEVRLADVVSAAARENPVACVPVEDASEAACVDSRADLAAVQRVLYRRSVDALLEAGVTILDPESVWVDAGVTVGPDSVLHPGVTLLGATKIGRGTVVHGGAWLRDSVVADEVEVLPYSVLDGARVASGCSVGPFARLRPDAVLEEGARVGNFVEVKKSTLGPGVKASHLAYLGDSSVGAGANIGAGVITCNYDGKTKSRTVIGEGAFVGSDTILVAPVEVGAGSYTGAGSVITKDVPEETLAVGRARQKNIKRRPR